MYRPNKKLLPITLHIHKEQFLNRIPSLTTHLREVTPEPSSNKKLPFDKLFQVKMSNKRNF